MSDTWDAEDRAIARALDAAPNDETAGADEHLVDEYRDVLGRMPIDEVPPPAGFEDRIVAAALDARPATVPTLDSTRARRTRRVRLAALGIATIAAAVVIGFIVQTGSTGSPGPGGHVTPVALQRTDIDALLQAPGTRTGTFAPMIGRVAIASDGKGAVYELLAKSAIGIGLVSSAGTTIIGPAQPDGKAIAFVVDHPERVTAVTLIDDGNEVARADLTPG